MWAMPSRRRTTFPTLSSPASNRRPCASLSCLTGIIAGLPLGRQLGSTSPQNPNVGNYRFFPGFVLYGSREILAVFPRLLVRPALAWRVAKPTMFLGNRIIPLRATPFRVLLGLGETGPRSGIP